MVAHAQAPAETERPQSPVPLWRHLFGEGAGFLCLFSGRRPAPGAKNLLDVAETYWPYPQSLAFAEQEAFQQDALGREVYFCAHLLRRKRRVKASAGPIDALWVDGDGATIPGDLPAPSAVVESSPGRQQYFWKLADPVEPAVAQELNRALAYRVGGDKGGWDLTQLLRVPGCRNRKYPDAPTVEAHWIDDGALLDAALLDIPLVPVSAPAREAARAIAADDNDDTEPPVRLGADGLAWWRGERVARKDDGGVDRSETLWGLGCALWDAGASGGTVAAALTERDATLGYGCYTDRPAEYLRLVGKLERRGAEPAAPTLATGDCETCARLREENRRLIAERRALLRAIANEKISNTGVRLTGSAVAFEYASQVEQHFRRHPNDPDFDGWVQMSRKQLTETTGHKPRRVTNHLKELEEDGFLEREQRPGEIRLVNGDGEVYNKPVDFLYVRMKERRALDNLEALATLDPGREEHRGGPRECPKHPEADYIVDTTVEKVERCAVCEDELGRTVERHRSRPLSRGTVRPPRAAVWEDDDGEDGGDEDWGEGHTGAECGANFDTLERDDGGEDATPVWDRECGAKFAPHFTGPMGEGEGDGLRDRG